MNIAFAILLIISFGLFGYISYKDFKFAVLLFAALLPTYLIRFSIGPIPATALEIFTLILIFAWIYKKQYQKIPWGRVKKWWSPVLLLFAAASFGVVVAPDTFGALGIWKAYYVEPIIIGLVFASVFKKADWKNVFGFMGIGAMIMVLFGIIQYLSGSGIPAPWDVELRITSFFDYPNALGLFLAPVVTASILMLIMKKRFLQLSAMQSMLFWSAIAMIGGIGISLAKTEAAFVAIPVALLATLLISNAKKTTKWRITIEVMLIFAVAFLTLPIIKEKILLQDYSGQVRIASWAESIEMLGDNPIFGAGLNGYPEALAPYHDATLYEIFQYPHNIILNFWSELGLLGVLALVWMIAVLLFVVIKERKDPMVIALFAVLAAMLIHGLVDVPFFKNDLAMMTAIMIAGLIAKK